jgi:hypothetical protein
MVWVFALQEGLLQEQDRFTVLFEEDVALGSGDRKFGVIGFALEQLLKFDERMPGVPDGLGAIP